MSLSFRMMAKIGFWSGMGEILEDENRRLHLFDDLVERRERVLGGGVAVFSATGWKRRRETMPLLKVHSKTFSGVSGAISTTTFWTRISSFRIM